MSQRYRISPQGPRRLSDADIARHADAKRLLYNYHHAVKPLYKRPLYKDPKTFIALVIIVLLAIILGEVIGKKDPPSHTPDRMERSR